MTDELTRFNNRHKNQEQFSAISEYTQFLLDKIEELEKDLELLKKKSEWRNAKIESPKEYNEYLVSYDKNHKQSFCVLHYDVSKRCWYQDGSELRLPKPYWWKEIIK